MIHDIYIIDNKNELKDKLKENFKREIKEGLKETVGACLQKEKMEKEKYWNNQ